MRQTFNSHVAEVGRLLGAQEQAIAEQRAATSQIQRSRSLLTDAAKAVVRVGRLVRLDDTTVETLHLPGDQGHDGLIAYARGLLEHVTPHAEAFITQGLPPDLLKALAERIDAFEAAREAQAASRQRFTTATKVIRERLDAGDRTLSALEALALNAPEAQPEALTRLRIAKRVGPRNAEPAPKPVATSPPGTKAA